MLSLELLYHVLFLLEKNLSNSDQGFYVTGTRMSKQTYAAWLKDVRENIFLSETATKKIKDNEAVNTIESTN